MNCNRIYHFSAVRSLRETVLEGGRAKTFPARSRTLAGRNWSRLLAAVLIVIGLSFLPFLSPIATAQEVVRDHASSLPQSVGVDARNRFVLESAIDSLDMRGTAVHLSPWSPFGVSVAPDGSLVQTLVLQFEGIPDRLGGQPVRAVAWLATPDLHRVRLLGPVNDDSVLSVQIDWSKFLVVVSAEPSQVGERWTGPLLLVGRSRSARLRPLTGHSVFDRAEF